MASSHYNEVHGHRGVPLARLPRAEIGPRTPGADPQDVAFGSAESRRPRVADTERRGDWGRRRAAPPSRSGDEMHGGHRKRQPAAGGDRAGSDPRAPQSATRALTH